MTTLLTGLRVTESSAFVAVPLAGMTLAQMGAEVIRFDRPTGGLDAGRWPLAPSGRSLFWDGLNKGKKSVAIDSTTPEGRAVMQEIITADGADAGIFLTNMAVNGVFDHATLSSKRPDMITATLAGDRHGRPAVDYTVNPALGIPDITGVEGSDTPVAHAIPAWDLLAGQMMVSAVLGAERHRLRSGRGQAIDLTLKDVAAAMIGHLGLIGDTRLNDNTRKKSGNALYGAYGHDFMCACGGRVMVIGLTRRQWSLLVKATGSKDAMADLERSHGRSLMDEGVRWELRHEITARLRKWFAARRIDEFADRFDNMGLTWSRFRTLKQAVAQDSDLTSDNPIFSDLYQPGCGTYPVPGLPAGFSDVARSQPKPAPNLGAHTEEILADVAKLPSGAIGDLFDRGIVASPHFRSLHAA